MGIYCVQALFQRDSKQPYEVTYYYHPYVKEDMRHSWSLSKEQSWGWRPEYCQV